MAQASRCGRRPDRIALVDHPTRTSRAARGQPDRAGFGDLRMDRGLDNPARRHSSLGMLSARDFETRHTAGHPRGMIITPRRLCPENRVRLLLLTARLHWSRDEANICAPRPYQWMESTLVSTRGGGVHV